MRTLQTHPRYLAAESRLEQSRAGARAADQALYNPALELEAEDADVRTNTAKISQTIDWGDQRGQRTRQAEARVRSAEATLIATRHRLLRDLLVSLTRYQTQQQLARLTRQRYKLMEEFAQLARRRYRAGDLSQSEFNLAQLAYQEASIQRARSLSEAARAEQDARRNFHTLPAQSPLPPVDLPGITLPVPLQAFLRKLPAVVANTERVNAARAAIKLRQSQRSADPTVSLKGGKEGDASLVGIALNIPLNVRNSYRAEVEAARAGSIAVEREAQQSFVDVRAELRGRARQYQLTRDAWQSWQSSGQQQLQSQLAQLKKLWRSGDIGSTEYLVQLKQALDTQAAGIQLRQSLWTAWFDWLQITARIEKWLQANGTHKQ
jgi:cobalt-zinc-cadmium efflux system outer membrane protein